MARYRESEFEENGPFDAIAANAQAKRLISQTRGNVTYNPNYVEQDAGPGPQEILNPYINSGPTPTQQQVVTQAMHGGRHADMIGPDREIGATISSPDGTSRRGSITATPAVLPVGWEPAQEVSHFAMPFPGAKLSEKQKQALNQAAIAEQMGLQSQLLAGEQRRDPGAFSQAYQSDLEAAANRLLPGERRMINVAPGQINIPTEQASRLIEQERMQEAAQRQRLNEYSQLPSTTKQGVEDAWRQHNEQYPWAAPGGDPPKTRAEVMQEIQMKEEQAFQTQLSDFSAQLGLPPIPMYRNKDGRLEPAVSIESLVAQQSAMQGRAQTDAARMRREQFDARMSALRATAPKRPDPAFATPDEVTAYNQYTQQVQGMVDEFYGGQSQQQSAQKPPSALPADTASQLPAVDFGDGLSAEREFDAGRLKAGQPFTVNGVRLQFDANGVVSRL